MRTDRERLIDISDAIDKIEEQTGLGEERFRSDEMVQVWVADIVGMRNIVVHEYFGLDLDRIWSTATSSLKPLREEIELLLPTM